MRVLTFMPRFWEKIKAGEKLQTCRLRAGCVRGDALSLRGWSGRPYMTPQIKLLEPVTCQRIRPVVIVFHDGGDVMDITLDGRALDLDNQAFFAVSDGFFSRLDMMKFFCARYPRMVRKGEPFDGVCISWRPGA